MTQIDSAEQAIDIIEEEFRKMAEKESSECIECGDMISHYGARFCEECANEFYGGDKDDGKE